MARGLRWVSPTLWVTFQTIFEQGFWTLLFAIQAPLLGPRPFGLISLAMVVIGFCEFIFLTVAAEALISLTETEEGHFATMLTASLVASLAAGGLILAGAGLVQHLVHDPELAGVLRWLAVLPILSAVGSVPTAVTKRNMQFQPLAMRSIFSLFAGGLVGLALTLAGAGVWALVWQAIVHRVVAAIALWLGVPVRFRLGFSAAHFGDLRRFASKLMLSRVMNWAGGQVPRFILGMYLGASDLGIYSLAGRLNASLVQVALEPKTTVARIYLRRYLAGREGLDEAVHRLLLQTSVFCFPLFMGAAAATPVLFHAWLGPQWAGGVRASQFMLLMGLPMLTFHCATAILLALNQQATEALISTVQTVTSILLVLAVAPFGLTVATAAIALRQLVLLPLPLILIRRRLGVPVREMLASQLPALLAASASALVVWLLAPELERLLGSVKALPLLVVIGAVVYAPLIALLAPGFVGEILRRVAGRLWRS
jgi:O-antigen/teichoic acid export membrane protein